MIPISQTFADTGTMCPGDVVVNCDFSMEMSTVSCGPKGAMDTERMSLGVTHQNPMTTLLRQEVLPCSTDRGRIHSSVQESFSNSLRSNRR
jgi:hypothetical protein